MDMDMCTRAPHTHSVFARALLTLKRLPLAFYRTVIDAACASLGLDLAELEPTVRALKRYGNQSSASFMFAYSEFLQHPPCAIAVGDCGAFITMGPGAGIEACLWSAGARAASARCVPLAGWVPASLPSERSSLVHRIDDPPP